MRCNHCTVCVPRADLIDYDRLEPSDHMGNLNNAFGVAANELGIPKILDAEGQLCTRLPSHRVGGLSPVRQTARDPQLRWGGGGSCLRIARIQFQMERGWWGGGVSEQLSPERS